ncbi:MAG: hypothetical protein JXQ90_19935 [Cyclobacteriaceae bacterium]
MSEINLAEEIVSLYRGDLVTSDSNRTAEVEVELFRLNNLTVNVVLRYYGQTISFKASLIEATEGVMFRVQDKIANNYMLSGESGFLYDRPNIHGGFIDRMDGLFFHISLRHFKGQLEELCFFGKKNAMLEA